MVTYINFQEDEGWEILGFIFEREQAWVARGLPSSTSLRYLALRKSLTLELNDVCYFQF